MPASFNAQQDETIFSISVPLFTESSPVSVAISIPADTAVIPPAASKSARSREKVFSNRILPQKVRGIFVSEKFLHERFFNANFSSATGGQASSTK